MIRTGFSGALMNPLKKTLGRKPMRFLMVEDDLAARRILQYHLFQKEQLIQELVSLGLINVGNPSPGRMTAGFES